MPNAADLEQMSVRVAQAIPSTVVVPVPTLLSNVCRIIGARFTLYGEPVPASYVMSPVGMLPCVALVAQESARRLLDADLGCSLRRDERGTFGLRAVVPAVTGNLADIVRALVFMRCATAVFGLRRNANIDATQIHAAFEGQFRAILQRSNAEHPGEIAWPQPFRPY